MNYKSKSTQEYQENMQPDVIIIDGSQLFYHISWPAPGHGQVKDITEGIKTRIWYMPSESEMIVLFDNYSTDHGLLYTHDAQNSKTARGSTKELFDLFRLILVVCAS